MHIEAFTRGKDPAALHANEDRFVILPGVAYAVIDGATDKLGTRYDGMLSGQYAAVLVKAALERLLAAVDAPLTDGAAIVEGVSAGIREGYARHGTLELARTQPNSRFSATLAVVTTTHERVHVWLVGDSGVRINGTTVLQVEKDLDLITSMLRQQSWPVIAKRCDDPLERERMSRLVSFHGTTQDPAGFRGLVGSEDLAAIERAAMAACSARLPHVPASHIANLVRGGIVNAQGGYQNDPSTILGYSCLDGFDVPMSLVHHETLDRSNVHTLELFSDGYFKPAEGFGVAAWEESFAEVEARDPEKVSHWLSPKGSTTQSLADDRTYLGVQL